ncbi:SurA N-terminal domain-containing protein [Macromonas bipunctata]|uniref:SurA N-terminal domain-containing protein n=1 Tax=Macromonas bipunctata TaxID=183670 RepID=UPI000C344D5C|nr:SurA N-terminal domain-containing protein [Macromonas bipunctata]
MFDFFRNHIKIFMGLLMLLIIPSFVLFGVEGYTDFRNSAEPVAVVGRDKITQEQLDAAHRDETERLLASRPQLDRAMLNSDVARRATLERMMDERVLALAADQMHFITSDQRLARELVQDPNIAALRQPDGTLDVQRYQELLRTQGLTPETFELSVRANLARQQVLQGISASAFVPASVAQGALNAFFEQREIQVARFAPQDFRSRVQLTDADVQQYYDANPAQFQAPEQVDMEYVVLDLDAIVRGIRLNEADVRAYYEQNQASQASKEERRARHILLTVAADAPAADKAKVRQQADALLAQLRQSPNKFAELAKQHSQDPGSATQGGDLGFFARGAMVKPFEDAVFGLKQDQISDVVESEFGLHIIQLTEVRQPAAQPFEQVRATLEQDLKRQQAQRQYAEAAETFSNLVYEQADSLQPVADKLGLTVHTATGVLRSGPTAADAPAVLRTPKLLEAVFAADALRAPYRNTEAVEAGTNQLVAARVLKHNPAHTRPLAEVAAQVRERLLQQRTAAEAVAEGQAKLAAWKATPAQASLAAPVLVSRNALQGLPMPVVAAALSADVSATSPAWAGVDAGPAGYFVLQVRRSVPRPATVAAQAQQENAQLAQMWAQVESQAYLQALRQQFKAEVVAKKPAQNQP